jgi:hypothetical protein
MVVIVVVNYLTTWLVKECWPFNRFWWLLVCELAVDVCWMSIYTSMLGKQVGEKKITHIAIQKKNAKWMDSLI